MTRSLMDSDPTRADARPDGHEVALTATVATARRALDATGANDLLVVHRGEPVGIVSAGALLNAAPASSVAEAMDYEVVHIDPTSGERPTVRAFTAAAWRSLLRRRPYRAHAPAPSRAADRSHP